MKLLFVPPDTRPITCAFPQALAASQRLRLLLPPAEALPQGNRAGDVTLLARWLEQEAADAYGLIVSLETLCLGGMIPARRVDDSREEALGRLQKLEQLKQRFPHVHIWASGVIVRVAHDDDPFEEKPYYGRYGVALRSYSEAFDRYQRQPSREHEQTLWQCVQQLPHDVLQNWLATRERNHSLHLQALTLLQQGVLTRLCLTLDDTRPYGLAACNRRELEAKTDALNLWPRVDIYPGADEVPMTLLLRAWQQWRQLAPQRVYVRYSSLNAEQAGMAYEDRPLGALVQAQLRAAGAQQVDRLEQADWVLAVNAPAVQQAHRQPDYQHVDTPARSLPAFVDFIAQCLQDKRPVSLADVAYPNGAEQRLLTVLQPRVRLAELAGFSAWNTAGNSLGSAIAMGMLAPRGDTKPAWLELLLLRFVDDYLYQSHVRPQVQQALKAPNPLDLGALQAHAEAMINSRLRPLVLELWRQHFAYPGLRLQWQDATLAWPRLFTGVFNLRVLVDHDALAEASSDEDSDEASSTDT